jgi:hypothetical protein
VSIVAAIWLVLAMAVPLAGSAVVSALAPSRSPAVEVNELREVVDRVQAAATGVIRRRLASHLGSAAAAIDPAVTEELEERLAATEAAPALV